MPISSGARVVDSVTLDSKYLRFPFGADDDCKPERINSLYRSPPPSTY